MSRISAFIFLFSLLGSSLHNTLVWMEFEWNKEYYATEKCVYKKVEGNDCQGSCQIRAILQGESENPTPIAPYQEESLTLINLDIFHWELLTPFQNEAQKAVFKVFHVLVGGELLIWRPPKV